MRALRKFPDDHPRKAEEMAESLGENIERLEVAINVLLKALGRIRVAVYILCACFLSLTVAAIVLMVAVLASSASGANLRRAAVVDGKYHAATCERLIGREFTLMPLAKAMERAAPCPDCKP